MLRCLFHIFGPNQQSNCHFFRVNRAQELRFSLYFRVSVTFVFIIIKTLKNCAMFGYYKSSSRLWCTLPTVWGRNIAYCKSSRRISNPNPPWCLHVVMAWERHFRWFRHWNWRFGTSAVRPFCGYRYFRGAIGQF